MALEILQNQLFPYLSLSLRLKYYFDTLKYHTQNAPELTILHLIFKFFSRGGMPLDPTSPPSLSWSEGTQNLPHLHLSTLTGLQALAREAEKGRMRVCIEKVSVYA